MVEKLTLEIHKKIRKRYPDEYCTVYITSVSAEETVAGESLEVLAEKIQSITSKKEPAFLYKNLSRDEITKFEGYLKKDI